jgi:hypothetical protein
MAPVTTSSLARPCKTAERASLASWDWACWELDTRLHAGNTAQVRSGQRRVKQARHQHDPAEQDGHEAGSRKRPGRQSTLVHDGYPSLIWARSRGQDVSWAGGVLPVRGHRCDAVSRAGTPRTGAGDESPVQAPSPAAPHALMRFGRRVSIAGQSGRGARVKEASASRRPELRTESGVGADLSKGSVKRDLFSGAGRLALVAGGSRGIGLRRARRFVS